MKKRLLTAIVIILLVILAGCKGASTPTPQDSTPTPETIVETTSTVTPSPTTETPTETPEPTDTPTATLPPQDYGPDNFPTNVNPLTGLPVSDPSLLDRRPMEVKIQTFPRGQRPPWAVSLADIVFDYYQNNGLTRLNAIFYGNDAEQVGPIRSARLLDASLVRMYKAIFAFGSADQRILNRLVNADFANRLVLEGSNSCPVMCRADPNGYNFLITNTKELGPYVVSRGVKNDRQDLNGMTFQHRTPEGGSAGTQVYTRYSISAYTRWDYDPNTGRYLRFEDTQEDTGQGEGYAPFMDRLTNQQVSAANVVVLFVPHQYAYKSGNSEIIDITLSGSGKAIAFRDGQKYDVQWNRPTPDSVLFLTNPDGSAFPFKPGITWFQVVGESSKIEDQGGGVWRFQHLFP